MILLYTVNMFCQILGCRLQQTYQFCFIVSSFLKKNPLIFPSIRNTEDGMICFVF